ncbi:nicotinate-nucleotide adenylyltransferase [Candidatus Poribacteria bacterium]|nr:nicotinate-nucleotide adenylyltransferase [Candidatus Poribacteria bacterium]
MRIGLFGGTFDPIHIGHLICADEVRDGLGLDYVWFIPAARPPHKSEDPRRASPEDRYRMVALAVEGEAGMGVSRVELERAGPSYAIDTVRHYAAEYPGAELYWILGVDQFREIRTWRDYDTLLSLCQFVCVTRPGYALSGMPDELMRRVRHFEFTPVGVSSTAIRAAVGAGRSIRFRTPRVVADYIGEKGIYL